MKTQLTKLIKPTVLAAAMLAGLCITNLQPALAGKTPPPNSSAFGQSLAAWEDLYARWMLGNVIIAPDANGNAVTNGLVLLPLPNASGNGTPASLNVTLNNGQAFMLPLWYLLGTSYTDGTPPDPVVDVSIFQTLNITFKVDGLTVVNSANVMNYYSEGSFTPPIPLQIFNINSVIWYETIGITHAPLTPGTHTLTLDVVNTQALPPNFGGGYSEFHNTWNITVNR